MSQPQTESYTASKGAISALTHALAISLSNKVRVNSISPGWINTTNTPITDKSDNLQHPSGRVGNPEDVSTFWFGLNAWLEKLRGSVRLEEAWPGFGCCLKGMRHQGTQPVPGLGEGQSGAT